MFLGVVVGATGLDALLLTIEASKSIELNRRIWRFEMDKKEEAPYLITADGRKISFGYINRITDFPVTFESLKGAPFWKYIDEAERQRIAKYFEGRTAYDGGCWK